MFTVELISQLMELLLSAPASHVYADFVNAACSLNGVASCRPIVSRLCALTGARCLSVQYRLAPQNPFPAALLDVMLVYLSLLYPPADSYHDPVEASSIVLAGDSSGASLCLSLIQVLIGLQKNHGAGSSIGFHNRNVTVQMPAGLTLLSVAGEITQALPSWAENGEYDILRNAPPTAQPDFPQDSIWPSQPPRSDPYCHDSALCHPLVAPVVAGSWAGAPPMWIACGQERLADSAKVIAQRAVQDGTIVLWDEYQSMPHTWPQIFPRWPQSVHCFESWAQACKKFADGDVFPKESVGRYIKAENMEIESVNVHELTPLTPTDAMEVMKEKCRSRRPFIGEKSTKASL